MERLKKQWGNFEKFLPGMRNMKTALTVVLCIAIGEIGPFSSPFFMALAGIITVQVSTIDSFNMGKNRILGTAIGAFVGMIFAFIQPENPLLAGLGIIIVIQICDKFNMHTAIQIATVVLLAVMLNMNGSNPVVYSISRLIDTSVGVIIALLVNYFIFPYNNLPIIKAGFSDLKMIIEEALEPVLNDESAVDGTQQVPEIESLDPTRQKLLWIRDQIKLYESEVQVKKTSKGEIIPYKEMHELYWDIFEHMKHIKKLAKSMNEASCKHCLEDGIECQELAIVFEYHLSQVRSDLNQLVHPTSL